MSVSDTILSKTDNKFVCLGRLSESGLKRTSTDLQVRDDNGKVTGTIKTDVISGSIAVECAHSHMSFYVYGTAKTSKGNDNPMWSMYEEMLNWNPKLKGNPEVEATLVNIQGEYSINDYIDRSGKIQNVPRWRVNRANTRVPTDQPFDTTLDAVLYIYNITNEVRNNIETGRLKLELYGADNSGQCFPVEAYVPQDLAEAFETQYETGMTAEFYLNVVSHEDRVQKVSRAMGLGQQGFVDTNSGSSVRNELILSGVSVPIEEPDMDAVDEDTDIQTAWINPVAMRTAMQERNIKLDNLKKNPPTTTKKKQTQSTSHTNRPPRQMSQHPATQNVFEEEDEDEDAPW